jgi:hypothetical protein
MESRAVVLGEKSHRWVGREQVLVEERGSELTFWQ